MTISMKSHGYDEYNSNLPLRMRLNLMRIRFALRSHGANAKQICFASNSDVKFNSKQTNAHQILRVNADQI